MAMKRQGVRRVFAFNGKEYAQSISNMYQCVLKMEPRVEAAMIGPTLPPAF